ncbi:hypothetical protein C2I36_15035 [Rhodobacteraceae bacterium WD3A24]|nr:hypothetical protein C2I36_15035 [Rhodobacteraceae bacterium WD3A24]
MPEPEGRPPQPWPFPALAPLEETIQWRTDVLPARDGEQRLGLRAAPRELVTMRHRFNERGVARAVEIARAGYAGTWQVPLWHMAAPVGDLASGATEIAVNTTIADYRAGGKAAVVDGVNMAAREAVFIDIDTVEAGKIVLASPLAAAHTHAVLAPVRDAVLTEAPQISRKRYSIAELKVGFTMVDAPDIAASTYPQHQGRDVLTDPTVVRNPVGSNIERAVEYVDAELGPIAVEPARDITARGEQITMVDHGLAKAWARRAWLFSLAGRLSAFWLPTWGRELRLQAGLSSVDLELLVAPIAPLDQYTGRHFMLEDDTGPMFREITAAEQDGDNHRLSFTPSHNSGIASSAPVHWMPLVRLDTDRVEITHTGTAMETRFNVIEVKA